MLAAQGAASAAARYNRIVTAKEELHGLIDRLADEQAQGLLDDLRGAADVEAELQRRKSNLQAKPDSGTDWESVKRAVRVRKDS